mmetsp:Transcript_9040/g.10455  ORF Transcript_9040/g.10455 Transcript_9040/m.10455 type:complete len:92 (+) Transcript_9040:126-401(+)|eukprot:CAMPEP_0197848282 /NCGR_PEP_ID=MMETSP1438-20131217/8136_1 /TAXON_ID=1461541 /ORGANISM="Pterosperma sp., Strain CCMP1384" /LENGTH=91 /DNA_ID=CAMNT_0043460443 /DNA_START=116 /DNA_END=391 /DNA_ORIENTATION=-
MRKISGTTSHQAQLWREVCDKELKISEKLETQYYDRDEGLWVQRKERLYFRPGGAPDDEPPPTAPPPEKKKEAQKPPGDQKPYNFHFLKMW